MPEHCPQCNHQELKSVGMGTAKVEESLNELFPQHDVIRVDRDSTSRVGSWQKIYDKIQKSEPAILLGTQMLAKGHHFPYVTLVAILDIDSGLLSVDSVPSSVLHSSLCKSLGVPAVVNVKAMCFYKP